MPLVAIEGPCCAGKTTLSRGLVAELPNGLHVSCYADWVGGGRQLPDPVPQSASDDADGLSRLLTIERDRLHEARHRPEALAIADRSAHTLLAHRAGVRQLNGLDLLTAAREKLASAEGVGWPDLVLYLDTPIDVIQARNRGRFPPGSVFVDPEFNAAFRGFFVASAVDRPDLYVWLDATESRQRLREHASAAITSQWPNGWPG